MRRVVRSVLVGVVFLAGTGLVFTSAPDATPNQPESKQSSMPAVDFIETAHAQVTCGSGGFACGNLEQNGTCCNDADHCCYVSPQRGSCYCVAQGDSCNRY